MILKHLDLQYLEAICYVQMYTSTVENHLNLKQVLLHSLRRS